MRHRASPTTLVLSALAAALPAWWLTPAQFVPFEAHLSVAGPRAEQVFDVPERQPLEFEFDLITRADGDVRPTATVTLNGVPILTRRAERLFAAEGGRVPVPAAAVQAGPNVMSVSTDAVSATVELRARVQNYRGLAPDFPRAAIVPDAAVAHQASRNSLIASSLRAAAFVSAALLLTWMLGRLASARTRAVATAHAWATPVLLMAAAAWSAATPLHAWLSVEATLILALVPWLVVAAVRWMAGHRATVTRALAITLLTAGLLEVSLRAYNRVRPSFVFYSEGSGRFRGTPGAPHFETRLNSRGFNDLERSRARPPGVASRILALGDSFVFGVVPYRDNFLTLAELELSRSQPVEILKMGVAGTDPGDYLALLVDEGLSYGPDLVLVNFFVGNDFEVRAPRVWERSFVATFIRFLWRRAGEPPAGVTTPAAAGGTYDDEAPGMSRERFLEVETARSAIYRDRAFLQAATSRVLTPLREMRALAAGAGAGFLVAILPDELQVNASLQHEIARAAGLSRDAFDWVAPNRAIAAALGSEGIAVVDLLPAFTASPGVTLYKPRDTHWNLGGNRTAAATLTPALKAALAK